MLVLVELYLESMGCWRINALCVFCVTAVRFHWATICTMVHYIRCTQTKFLPVCLYVRTYIVKVVLLLIYMACAVRPDYCHWKCWPISFIHRFVRGLFYIAVACDIFQARREHFSRLRRMVSLKERESVCARWDRENVCARGIHSLARKVGDWWYRRMVVMWLNKTTWSQSHCNGL